MTADTPTLLLVDDDPAILHLVERFGERVGFAPIACAGGRDALRYLAEHQPDVAVVDLWMPDIGGLEVLRAIRHRDPACQVILMSGAATIESAVEAVKLGAVDYLTKPFELDRLGALLRTSKDVSARRTVQSPEAEVSADLEFCGMIGRSPSMRGLFGIIQRLAPHVRTVLVSGETGVGKELVARAIHLTSVRRDQRFVTVNCSALTEVSFERQLFGHVGGGFTGATHGEAGLFELADGGTVFLDEVGELPLAVQAKLLRVLESGEVRRVGAVEGRHTDVQIIAATNRNLRIEVATGRFRADLFYRLSVVNIVVPPLRQRRDDIPLLAADFIREAAGRLGKPIAGATPEAEERLIEAPWDGNVRELRNVIEHACLLADGELITEHELVNVAASSGFTAPPQQPLTSETNGPSLADLERARILEVLRATSGNKMAAARILGLSRRALYRRLQRYGYRT